VTCYQTRVQPSMGPDPDIRVTCGGLQRERMMSEASVYHSMGSARAADLVDCVEVELESTLKRETTKRTTWD
jgi:hypothetical protein